MWQLFLFYSQPPAAEDSNETGELKPAEDSNAEEYPGPDEPPHGAVPSAADHKLLLRGAVDAEDPLPVQKDKLMIPSLVQFKNPLGRTLITASNQSIHINATSRSAVYESTSTSCRPPTCPRTGTSTPTSRKTRCTRALRLTTSPSASRSTAATTTPAAED